MSQAWRRTKEYSHWRVHVIRRDKVCRVCGTNKNRHSHHIEHASYNPSRRFDVSNGVCLCRTCHTSFHIDYKRGYRKKGTEEDFKRFIKITNLKGK